MSPKVIHKLLIVVNNKEIELELDLFLKQNCILITIHMCLFNA